MATAVGLWVRADWRRRYRALIALTLLAGLSFAVVAVAFAGSRRTISSFDRLLTATRAYDHGVVIDSPGSSPTGDDAYDAATVDRIRHLPEVGSVGAMTIYVASLAGSDNELALNVPEDTVVGYDVERLRVLRGRMPAPDQEGEVAINEAAVAQSGIDVGDELTIDTLSPEQRMQIIGGDSHAFDRGPLGPELSLRVVGVLRGPGDVTGRSDPAIYGTPAFDRAYRGRVAYSARILVVKRAAGYTAAEFEDAVDGVTSGFVMGTFDSTVEYKPAQRTTHMLGIALGVFALIAAGVSMLAVNQAVTRHVQGAGGDLQALTALGLTRAQRVRAGVLSVAPAAVGAAVLAVLVGYLASPAMPVGLARRVEPDPGFRFDPTVAALVALAVFAIVIVTASIAAALATRTDRSSSRIGRATFVSSALASAGVRPVPATGIRMAFDRRTPSLPVRSTLLGVAAALAVLAGALTFSTSLGRLEASPGRWGFGWDLMLDTTNDQADGMIDELQSRDDVAGASLFQSNFTLLSTDGRIDGSGAYGLGTPNATVGYDLLTGSQPVGPDEVVIGPATAERFDLKVGDVLDIAVCPCTGDPANTTTAPVRVVGTALFPEGDNGTFNDALGFSTVGFEHHVGPANEPRVALRVAPGDDVTTVANALDGQFPGALSTYGYPSRPGDVANLGQLRAFPRVLALVAVVLGLSTLANLLFATKQRRQRELATLRSLGLTSHATRNSIVWQSLAITAVAAAIGVIVGVTAGAAVWRAAVLGTGVATDASHPLAAIGVCLIIAFLTATALGLVVGSRAAHLRIADSLRRE